MVSLGEGSHGTTTAMCPLQAAVRSKSPGKRTGLLQAEGVSEGQEKTLATSKDGPGSGLQGQPEEERTTVAYRASGLLAALQASESGLCAPQSAAAKGAEQETAGQRKDCNNGPVEALFINQIRNLLHCCRAPPRDCNNGPVKPKSRNHSIGLRSLYSLIAKKDSIDVSTRVLVKWGSRTGGVTRWPGARIRP